MLLYRIVCLSIAFCALQDGHVSGNFLTEKFFPSKIVKAIDVLMNSILLSFVFVFEIS